MNEIDRYYKLWKNSLKCYRNEMLSENMDVPAEFIGCTKDELREEFNKLESEVEKCAVLNIITAVEAEFRIDFIIRWYACDFRGRRLFEVEPPEEIN